MYLMLFTAVLISIELEVSGLPTAINWPPTIKVSEATVSWYGPGFHGQTMANGDKFDQHDPTIAAHRDLPFGSIVWLRNPANDRAIYVRIRDRGPFIAGRDLDISQAAAEQLDIKEDGVARLELMVIPSLQ